MTRTCTYRSIFGPYRACARPALWQTKVEVQGHIIFLYACDEHRVHYRGAKAIWATVEGHATASPEARR